VSPSELSDIRGGSVLLAMAGVELLVSLRGASAGAVASATQSRYG
jgi:hypothetical protein